MQKYRKNFLKKHFQLVTEEHHAVRVPAKPWNNLNVCGRGGPIGYSSGSGDVSTFRAACHTVYLSFLRLMAVSCFLSSRLNLSTFLAIIPIWLRGPSVCSGDVTHQMNWSARNDFRLGLPDSWHESSVDLSVMSCLRQLSEKYLPELSQILTSGDKSKNKTKTIICSKKKKKLSNSENSLSTWVVNI